MKSLLVLLVAIVLQAALFSAEDPNFAEQHGLATATQGTEADSAYAATQAATASNTVSTIVKRDSSGNFAAGTITANLTGNASGTAANVTGTVAVANGGTGATTAAAARSALGVVNNVTTGAYSALPATEGHAKGDVYVSNEGDFYVCCAIGTGTDTSGWKKGN